MLAALGSGCLPCRSRSARCNARNKSVQVPYASQTPEMVEDGLPRWKVGWEIAPWTARAQHVEDRIENSSQRVNWRPATSGHGWKMALQTRPLRIRKIAGITGTHPSSLSFHVRSFPRLTKHGLSVQEAAEPLLTPRPLTRFMALS